MSHFSREKLSMLIRQPLTPGTDRAAVSMLQSGELRNISAFIVDEATLWTEGTLTCQALRHR